MVDFKQAKQLATLGGRLSFHTFTAQQAYEEALESPFAASVKGVSTTSPYANLLLTQAQADKVLKAAEAYLDAAAELYKQDDKAKGALSPAQVAQLKAEMENPTGLLNTPFKMPSEKTLELMPDAVLQVKLIGNKGSDFKLEALLQDESRLDPPDPDIITFPVVVPLSRTDIEMYNGCWVIAKGLGFYSYLNGGPKKPGFSLGCSQLVFSRDAQPFAGGAAVSDEDIFLAADEL